MKDKLMMAFLYVACIAVPVSFAYMLGFMSAIDKCEEKGQLHWYGNKHFICEVKK